MHSSSMTDIRAFLTEKQVPDPNSDVEDEQDEVSWEIPLISRVPNLVPERQGVLPCNNNVVERHVDRAAQERIMLLETLNQLKEEELYWSQIAKEYASKASSEDAIGQYKGHRRASSEVEPDIVLPPSLYSVRPLVGQNDLVLNMFHGLTFTSPVSSRVSQSLMSYRFNGLSAVRLKLKRPASLLKFVCQINVNTLDNSVDAFSLEVTSPFTAKKELNGFLTACKRDKDISRALYGLSSYSELLIKRYSVFEIISSTYKLSKDSTWPMGHTLAFPDTGAQLFISWKINLGEDNLVAEPTSTIQAFVRPSQSLLYHDKAGTFSQINNIFTSLIEEHGVLHAISTLHDILYN